MNLLVFQVSFFPPPVSASLPPSSSLPSFSDLRSFVREKTSPVGRCVGAEILARVALIRRSSLRHSIAMPKKKVPSSIAVPEKRGQVCVDRAC